MHYRAPCSWIKTLAFKYSVIITILYRVAYCSSCFFHVSLPTSADCWTKTLRKVHPRHCPGGRAAASGGARHGGHRVERDLPPLPSAREARHSNSGRNSVSCVDSWYLLKLLRIRSESGSSILAEYRSGSRAFMSENWQKLTKKIFLDQKLLYSFPRHL